VWWAGPVVLFAITPGTARPVARVAPPLSSACCGRRQIAGYWAFGYDVGDNILQTVGKPKWLIVMANLMVVRPCPS